MKSNAPWSVKGIERDARETAKQAARREGMTVGEWLNQIIYNAGELESSGGDVEGIKLRDIITAVEHLHKKSAENNAENAGALGGLTRKIGDVVERVQRLERTEPDQQAESREAELAARIEQLEAKSGGRDRVEALRALEKAVGQVAAQFNNAYKISQERLDASEQQMQELAARLDSAPAPSANIETNNEALDAINARLDQIEKIAGDALAQKSDASSEYDPDFVETTGNRLRVLGEEIKRGGDQITTLEATIGKLAEQIDAAERRSAEGVQKLSDALGELNDKTANENVTRADIDAAIVMANQDHEERFDDIQSALSDIASRLEKNQSHSAPTHTATDSPDAPDSTDEDLDTPEALSIDGDQLETETISVDATGDGDLTEAIDNEADADDFSFDLDDASGEISEENFGADNNDGDLDIDGNDPKLAIDNDGGEVEAGAFESTFDENETPPDEARSDAAGGSGHENILSEIESFFENDGLSANAAEPEAPSASANDDEDELGAAEAAASLTDNPADEATGNSNEFGDESDDENDLSALFSDPDDADDQSEPLAPKVQIGEAKKRRSPLPKSDNPNPDDIPARGNLTAKQRAILAARAKKQREARSEEQPSPQEIERLNAARKALLDSAKPTGSNPRDTLAGKTKDEKSELDAGLKADNRRGLTAANSATETLTNKTESARKDSEDDATKSVAISKRLMAYLGAGIVLLSAALVFLMKDIIFRPERGPQGAPALTTPNQGAPTLDGSATGDASTNAATIVGSTPALDPRAHYIEAMNELSGTSGDVDIASAVKKLEEAAALGHPPAQLQIGELYKSGQGLDADPVQARNWFRRAANGGNVLAMHRLGVMTARGEGGAADTAEAVNWFEKAANFGLVDSQYNLGAIYHPSANSDGSTIQDAGQAYYWYSLAANSGDEQARPLADVVATALSAEQKQAIDQSIASWSAQPQDQSANEIDL